MKRLILIATLITAFIGALYAQEGVKPEGENTVGRSCGFVEAHQARLAADPKLLDTDEFEDWLSVKMAEFVADGRVVQETIPVAFIVIHRGEAVGSGTNISETYLNAQIDQLNNDYGKILGTSGYNTNPVGVDTDVRFSLGVVRRYNYGSATFSQSYIDNTVKPATGEDPNQYLNFWVVPLSGGLLGYAQFPNSSGLGGLGANNGGASTDGVVCLNTSVGSTVTPHPGGGAFDSGRTATHEIGHWLGLRHIWGDGGCGVDDFVTDTPESDASNFGCPTTHVSCSSTDMVQNYMDYTDDSCMNIFTAGQKTRILTVLANSPRRQFGGGGGGTGCTGSISSFPYSEGFESGLGAWSQGSGDDFDWTRDSGGTPSSNTGPSSGSGSTWYVYTESSSPNYSNKTSILNGPCFDLSGHSSASFSFDYHMYGSTAMGSLYFEASTDGGSSWSTLWSRSSNQGNSWLSANVNMDSYTGGTVQVRFRGVTGTTWQGDMAIDNVGLSTSGGGGGGTTQVTVSITFDNYPEETSWEIKDGSTVVASGGTYGSQPDGSTLNIPVTLADGCYDFIIYDSYGDGICCAYGSGSYTVSDSGGTLASGGSFTSSETTPFCVP
jgi:hypothetical protein